MKLVIPMVSIFLTSTFAATLQQKTSISQTREGDKKLQDSVRQESSCNLTLCFAMDGSASITDFVFNEQMYFLVDFVAITRETRAGLLQGIHLAAVQYGDSVQSVSSLTNDDVEFSTDIFNAVYLGAQGTNIAAGINYCSEKLAPSTEQVIGIVLFTDGRATLGRDPVVAANRFRDELGGKIFVVGIGLEDNEKLLEIAGGSEDDVFSVAYGSDIFSIIDKLDKLVQECESLQLATTSNPVV